MIKPTHFLFGALLFSACTEDPKQSEPYLDLKETHERTQAVVADRDSTINDLFGSFNRISENLRAIREKQGALDNTANRAEPGKNMEQQIIEDISMIDSLLQENKALVADLRKRSKKNASAYAELEKAIAEMERTIGEKDSEIGTLKEQLSSTNSSLATLIEMYRDKEQLADLQRNELNTNYYAMGTAKELRENGVLTTEGGFVGLGKTTKLNTSDLNHDYFKEIDKTITMEFPIKAKKAHLATSHPAGSYRFEGEVDRLIITDPNAFWSLSKYLVIVVDQ